jgi:RecA-family ATPase
MPRALPDDPSAPAATDEVLPGMAGPEDWAGVKAPDRRFLIDGWLVRGAAGLLGGEDGVGKSLLGQQMATCGAAGVDFLGLPIERARALYITCEDPIEELHRRQECINAALGVDMGVLKGWLRTSSLKGHIGNELATFDKSGQMTPTRRYAQVRQAALDFGAALIFIDNSAHVFPGNENARHDVAAFLGLLEQLSIEIDGAVVLLAHPNKQHSQGNTQGNEYSGSTGWSAHVRNRLFLDWDSSDPPNPDGRLLRRSKSNYAVKGEEISFVWHNWAFTRFDDLPVGTGAELRAVAKANAENDAFLRCLATCTEKRRAVSHNPGTNYAPKIFAGMPEAKGVAVKAFKGAMERLLHIGEIELDAPLWQDAHRHWKQGIRAVKKCGDPLAVAPCGDLRRPPPQTGGNPCGDPRAATPPSTTYIMGAAHEAAAPDNDENG